MYALPELEDTIAAWWRGIAEHMRQAGAPALPEEPEHPSDLDSMWLSPTLVLAQTCGYPLTHDLAGRARYVATLCHGAPGCAGPNYRSCLIVRQGDPAKSLIDLRGRRAVINSWESHSGMNALGHALAQVNARGSFFSSLQVSGGHRKSLAWLREGCADVAAIDCVTYALLQQEAPQETKPLRVLEMTDSAPWLPLITALTTSDAEVGALRLGLRAAVADRDLEPLRRRLLVTGVEVLPEGAYRRILDMERVATALSPNVWLM